MKLTSNIKDFAKQFEEYKKEVERKLKGMVEIFSINIVINAINTTPYGVQNSLYDIPARAQYGLEPYPGHARGGWIVGLNSYNKTDLGNRALDKNDESAFNIAESKLKSYKLGQEVFIVNNVPYVANSGITTSFNRSLEDGYSMQAPSGISAPTIESILSIYQLNLKDYYDES